MEAIAAAFALTLAVIGGIAFIVVRVVDALVPPNKLPDLVCLFLLLIGWFVAVEICNAVIENTPLRSLEWGGAGENYFFPFAASSIIVAAAVLVVRVRRHKRAKDGA